MQRDQIRYNTIDEISGPDIRKIRDHLRKMREMRPGAYKLKVMTFNLRFDNPDDGVHQWAFRRDSVVAEILTERPDLLGTQEGIRAQLDYLNQHLEGYAPSFLGRVPDPDPRVQCPTIFFRIGDLRLKEGGEFWLSETPHIHRSKSWNAAFPRLFTFARFLHRPSGTGFWFANTHLDHVSGRARLESAKLIRRWARRKRLPIILAGDFNDLPGSGVHGTLTRPSAGFRDTWQVCRGAGEHEPSTIHHFTGIGAGGRIDWILTSPGIRVLETRILDFVTERTLPSDHFPYVAEVEVPSPDCLHS